MPDTAPVDARSRSRVLSNRVRSELLAEDGELRAVLVHADVRTAHTALAGECRPPVKDTVVVHD